MKSYSLHAVSDLRYEELPEPELKKNWCLVKVMACGICSSDIPRIFSKGTYNFPTIPGHEFSGIVEKVFDKENENLIGKRVGVFPLIPCFKCDLCKQKHYEMCEHYDYLGSRRNGGFSEYVEVPVWNLIELPKNISFETAAMLEPLSVALHAVKQSDFKSFQTAAIVGTGMIGFAASLWFKLKNAKNVTVFGRSEEKRKIAEKINGINYLSSFDNKDSFQFDVVLEAVGNPDSIIQAIKITKPGGTLVLMGNPCCDINLPQNIFWRILRKQLHIVGTWNSFYEKNCDCDWSESVKALSENKINVDLLITHKFNQDKVMDGLNLMKDSKEPYCKIMTLWNR